ncbi:methyltransferase domain-containing protein [Nocardioides mesophilus]|uniref:Methyltransferase domain-containing protein n=1 Tax=Nocardioides mesophilus TaxID=433659 RepID=A0A7G9RBY0_9ACTN|nr:methyltransferase domain-containing protein [Nocardioides mesophilus]QNN53105.1 methyltransferase domain-containing protein [Nocardioides mesophilus]
MSGDQPPSRSQPVHRRSAARTAVVWDAVQELLASGEPAGPVAVVDIGGGTGGFAVPVAALGHRVTVVDPSPDALAILGRRAEESGVADLVTGQQGDLGTLADLLPADSADVVLCHGVLELVEDPAVALEAIARVLRPGGFLSLLVSQRHAAVVARAMAGHFGQARALLEEPGPRAGDRTSEVGSGRHRFTAEELTSVLDATGYDTVALHAVRVFVDLVPSSLVDLEPGAAERLVELEQAVASRPEYLPLGTQVHALARRR